LQFLQKELGEKLSELSLAVDSRPWQAHLTLGRASGNYFLPKNLPVSNLAAFTINSVELMSSELLAAGPEYAIVSSIKF
jgi:2'-5' RNA ligase